MWTLLIKRGNKYSSVLAFTNEEFAEKQFQCVQIAASVCSKKIINYATALNLMKERFLNAKLQIAAVLWSAVSNPLPCRSSLDTCRCCRIFQDLEDPFVEFLDVLSGIEHRRPNFHRYTTVGPRILQLCTKKGKKKRPS